MEIVGKTALMVNETMGEAAAAPAVVDSTVTMATTKMSEVSIDGDEGKSSNYVGGKRDYEEVEVKMADTDTYWKREA